MAIDQYVITVGPEAEGLVLTGFDDTIVLPKPATSAASIGDLPCIGPPHSSAAANS